MFLGLAYTIGPVIAGAIYFKLDYTFTLYFFAIVIAIVGFGSIFFLPSRLNESEGVASYDGKIQDVPYCDLFKNKRSFYGIISKFISALAFTFYDPILSIHLQSAMSLKDEEAFLGFSLLSLAYSIGAFAFGKMSEHGNKQNILTASFFFFSIFIYISGGFHNVITGHTAYFWLCLVGLAGVGFF